MMRVIDEHRVQQPGGWHLLEDESLYIYVYCSYSFVDYGFVMALNDDETSRFHKSGRNFLDTLASKIHSAGPGVLQSKTPFKARSVLATQGAREPKHDRGPRAELHTVSPPAVQR